MLRAALVDFPDLTIGGFTPTDEQWAAAVAVAVGAVAAVLAMALWRRARTAIVVGVISITVAVLWLRFHP